MDSSPRPTKPHWKLYRLLIGVAAIGAIIAWAAGDAPSTEPAKKTIDLGPVVYRQIVRSSPAQVIHVVSVDLTDPRVVVRVCGGGKDPDGDGQWETTLATVPEIARRENLVAAVNGSLFECKEPGSITGIHDPYFTGNWARALGYTMSDGTIWSARPNSIEAPSLVISGDRTARIGSFASLPSDSTQAVSGVEILVRDAKNVAPSKAQVAPRTAVGLARNGSELILLVVDGDRPDEAAGLTLPQMADELVRLGCRDGMSLDSGGSSTMALRSKTGDWDVMNHPSDGHTVLTALSVTRPVANALGVMIRDVSATQPVDPR